MQNKQFLIDVGQVKLEAEQCGSGMPLICLHAGVADLRMWGAQMAAFSADYRPIAYNRPGFGNTPPARESFAHTKHLLAVYEQLGVTQAVLIGCSQGARIAIDFALTYPKRVRALVLIAPAITGAPRMGKLPDAVEKLLIALDKADQANDVALVNQIEAHLWLDGPQSERGRVSGELRALFLDMNGRALQNEGLSAATQPQTDAYRAIRQFPVPTLVMVGMLDFPHMLERSRYIAQALTNATGVMLADVAHLPTLEQPDVVNEHIGRFLQRVL